jgi:hypothetical protein
LAALWCCSSAVLAQQPASAPNPPPPTATPQSEAGEPRANTGAKPSAQSEAGEPRASSTGAPGSAQAEAGEPRAAAPPAKPPAAARATAGVAPTAGPKGPTKVDRLELSTATVTGDREQPKVMYIVPWKRSDIGDLEGKPMNSLVDEILAPVDRDVFRREVRYYQTVKTDASSSAAKPPSGQGEK